MNQIQQHPNRIPEFGYEFSYELWTPGTEVTLCNVPWFNDYRDIVQFENQAAFDRWINDQGGATINVTNLALIKPNQPIRLDIPFNTANQFNYIAVRSPEMPTGAQGYTFYYFIVSVNYVAPNTTELIVQLDVWQSFGHQVKIGRAYVERGHVGIADVNSFDLNGRNMLTTPEGLDIGGEYGVVNDHVRSFDNDSCSVMIVSTTNLTADPGSVNNPTLTTAVGNGTVNGIPNGADTYFFESTSDFKAFLNDMRGYPWVTRGIIAAYLIPPLKDRDGVFQYNNTGVEPHKSTVGKMIMYTSFHSEQKDEFVMDGWRNTLINKFPPVYRKLKKFLTFPYCAIELTTYSGTPLILKPELMEGNDIKLRRFTSLTLPNPRVVWYPVEYNRAPYWMDDGNGNEYNPGEYMDVQTGIYNFPQVPVVNDEYINLLASSVHSREYAQNSADWSQQRTMAANQLAYDQSSAGIDLANQITDIGINTRAEQLNLSNKMVQYSAAKGIASGLMTAAGGNPGSGIAAGAVAGIDGWVNTQVNNKQNMITNQNALSMNSAVNANTGYVRDTNKSYADWAAKGDYQNAIAGINAKIQDAKLTQPSISGQHGGEPFNVTFFKTKAWKIHIKIKMLNFNALVAIGDYWLRYGYAMNRFISNMPDNLNVMSKFTYWKLKETYFETANCPENYRQTIRGIFEKGVTVWANPDDIGTTYIGDNEPIEARYF